MTFYEENCFPIRVMGTMICQTTGIMKHIHSDFQDNAWALVHFVAALKVYSLHGSLSLEATDESVPIQDEESGAIISLEPTPIEEAEEEKVCSLEYYS